MSINGAGGNSDPNKYFQLSSSSPVDKEQSQEKDSESLAMKPVDELTKRIAIENFKNRSLEEQSDLDQFSKQGRPDSIADDIAHLPDKEESEDDVNDYSEEQIKAMLEESLALAENANAISSKEDENIETSENSIGSAENVIEEEAAVQEMLQPEILEKEEQVTKQNDSIVIKETVIKDEQVKISKHTTRFLSESQRMELANDAFSATENLSNDFSAILSGFGRVVASQNQPEIDVSNLTILSGNKLIKFTKIREINEEIRTYVDDKGNLLLERLTFEKITEYETILSAFTKPNLTIYDPSSNTVNVYHKRGVEPELSHGQQHEVELEDGQKVLSNVNLISMSEEQEEEYDKAHAALTAHLTPLITILSTLQLLMQWQAQRTETREKETTKVEEQPRAAKLSSGSEDKLKPNDKLDKKVAKWLGSFLDASTETAIAANIKEKNQRMLDSFRKQIEDSREVERTAIKKEIAQLEIRYKEILKEQKNETTLREPEKLSMFHQYVQALYESLDTKNLSSH